MIENLRLRVMERYSIQDNNRDESLLLSLRVFSIHRMGSSVLIIHFSFRQTKISDTRIGVW